jgi:hypothetical protein
MMNKRNYIPDRVYSMFTTIFEEHRIFHGDKAMTNQHTNYPDTFLVEEYGKITMVISQMRRRFESVH